MENPPNVSQIKFSPTATSPPTFWTADMNIGHGYTYLVVPASGNLWVNVSANAQAEELYVLHTNGTQTPINLGENNIAVNPADMIVYKHAPKTPTQFQFQLT